MSATVIFLSIFFGLMFLAAVLVVSASMLSSRISQEEEYRDQEH